MNVNGFTLYDGPSVLDGAPIIAILTLHSANRKTGDMAQVWILRRDHTPIEATKRGLDASVCGSCQHRHHLGGACYVQPAQAPGRVWRSFHEGRYPPIDGKKRRRIRGRAVRLGAYGDPAAVPVEVWQPLVKVASMTTGYTHQADHPHFDRRLLAFCMVSVDSAEGVRDDQRSFRVKAPGEPLLAGEVLCPASVKEDIQCLDCGLCSGAHRGGPSVAIDVHGSRAKRFTLIKTSAA